jgi:hypothetical protein
MAQMIGGNTVNWQQQEVPFSRFGTRKVAWFKVGYADTKSYNAELDVYQLDQVQFNRMISIVQSQAEVVMIGAPEVRNNFGKFMIAVFEDTCGNGDLTDPGEHYNNNKSQTIQQALRDALDDNDISFERFYLRGAPESGDNSNYGWSDSDTYQEYDRKSDFLNNSYTQNDC